MVGLAGAVLHWAWREMEADGRMGGACALYVHGGLGWHRASWVEMDAMAVEIGDALYCLCAVLLIASVMLV